MRRTVVRLLLTAGTAVAVLCGVLAVVLLAAQDRSWADVTADREAGAVAGVAALSTDPETLRREIGRTGAGRDGRLTVSAGGRTVGTLRGGLRPSDTPGPVLERHVTAADGGPVVIRVRPVAAGPSAATLTAGAAVTAAGLLVAAGAALLALRRVRPITAELADLTAWVDAPPGSPEPAGPQAGFPETAGLRAALVRLEAQLERARGRERRVVEDLSHRLRTPLTALFLDVDGLDDGPAATRVRSAVSALDRAVDVLIRTPPQPEAAVPACDVVEVVGRRMEFWSGLARIGGRPVGVELAPDPAPVALPDDHVAAVLDALVGNVFRHTADGTGFRVTVVAHRSWVSVVVDDAGRGIADPAAALRRGVSGAGSTGLGLAIARDAVESTGGTIHLERSSLEGTRVRLRFAGLATEHGAARDTARDTATGGETIGQRCASVRAPGRGGGAHPTPARGVIGA